MKKDDQVWSFGNDGVFSVLLAEDVNPSKSMVNIVPKYGYTQLPVNLLVCSVQEAADMYKVFKVVEL